MRAVAIFPAEKSVRVIDHPEPRPAQASDVLLRILDVGVCGTDREIARGDYGTPPAGSPYLVLGHESLAEVIEIDTDLIMRNLVLKNQLVDRTVNAGSDAFEAAVTDLAEFQRRWPGSLGSLITARHPPDDCRDLLLGPRVGIKPVVTFAGVR